MTSRLPPIPTVIDIGLASLGLAAFQKERDTMTTSPDTTSQDTASRIDIARRLDGVMYPDLPADVVRDAKARRVVIIRGQSDDYVILDGAIQDEVYHDFRLTRDDVLSPMAAALEEAVDLNSRYGDNDPRALDSIRKWVSEREASVLIKADYTDGGWKLETQAPHSTFRIMEDEDELHSYGLVIALDELPGLPAQDAAA